MKNITISPMFALSLLAACGPGPNETGPKKPVNAVTIAPETLPHYDSTGVISAVNGLTLTLDHDGASAAGLAAGRNDFVGYADVLSDAPLALGTRVAFRFRKTEAGLELSDLKAR